MRSHRKQHTVPRSYLAAWIDPVTPPGQTGAIWRISKDRSVKRRRAPENCFTQTDRYTICLKDGTRNLAVEHSLAQIENDFQDVLKSIRRQENLNLRQRAKLCVFTAAMMGRSKKQGDWIERQWITQIEKVKQMENRMAQTCELTQPTLSHQLEEATENSHANLVIDTIKTCLPVLFSMSLTILTSDDSDGFITSDAPAVMYNPKAHTFPPFYRSPGLLQSDVEVSLPLSPREFALFSHKPIRFAYIPIQTRVLDEANRTTFFFSDAEFVSWKGNTREAWFEEREAHPDAWERIEGAQPERSRAAEA